MATPRADPRRGDSWRRRLEPVPWLAPVLVLLLGIVVYPMLEMIRTSFSEISRSGLDRGFIGLDNFVSLVNLPDLPRISGQTLVWLIAVVTLTLVISWPIAVLLHQRFPGRTLVRYAVIVPWAASLVMTSLVFGWMYHYYYGAINAVLMRIGLISEPVDWLGSATIAMISLIIIGVYVSVPFNSYVLLAGLQAIPSEIYEAAKLDGAGPLKTWFHITRPMLSSSVLVAVALNIVGVFNSFPIIWLVTGGGPNRSTHTTITYMYELAFRSRLVGESAALSVFNLFALLAIVVVYLRFQRKSLGASA